MSELHVGRATAELGSSTSSLSDFSTATIHEVAGPQSALPSQIRALSPTFRLCGPATTVASPPGDNLWLHRAVYAAEPGAVLVATFGGEFEAGYWGEILSTAALERGLAGVVLDGCARDSIELSQLGFPVFARGLCVRRTSKEPSSDGAIGATLWVGRARVQPGDLIVGDLDGVVVVNQVEVNRVLAGAATRVAREAQVLSALRAGHRTLDLLGLPATDT